MRTAGQIAAALLETDISDDDAKDAVLQSVVPEHALEALGFVLNTAPHEVWIKHYGAGNNWRITLGVTLNDWGDQMRVTVYTFLSAYDPFRTGDLPPDSDRLKRKPAKVDRSQANIDNQVDAISACALLREVDRLAGQYVPSTTDYQWACWSLMKLRILLEDTFPER